MTISDIDVQPEDAKLESNGVIVARIDGPSPLPDPLMVQIYVHLRWPITLLASKPWGNEPLRPLGWTLKLMLYTRYYESCHEGLVGKRAIQQPWWILGDWAAVRQAVRVRSPARRMFCIILKYFVMGLGFVVPWYS